MSKMRVLSLFSGIGGHDLGLQRAGMRIVGQVEIDDYCQKNNAINFPRAHRWLDIQGLTANDIRRHCGRIDLLTGGFPCQDISVAGAKAGIKNGLKSGLWREMWRLIRDLRPNWLLIENVPRLRIEGGDTVLGALEMLDYTCWPLVVGALHFDAPHERQRVWIVARLSSRAKGRLPAIQREALAYSSRQGEEISDCQLVNTDSQLKRQSKTKIVSIRAKRNARHNSRGASPLVQLEHSEKPRHKSTGSRKRKAQKPGSAFPGWPMRPGFFQHEWEPARLFEPGMGYVFTGSPDELALRALGNCNPPQITEAIGKAIIKIEGIINS